MLDNSSHLLLRHQVVTSTTLLVNAQDALARQEGCASLFCYAHLFAQFGTENDSFAATVDAQTFPENVDQVVLYVPKEKSLCRMLFDNLAARMPEGATLYLVGPNKGGIKSVIKQLPAAFNPAHKVASGNHCVLFATTRTDTPVADFSLHAYLTSYLVPAQPELKIFNLPGVFSEQRLDAGTALLLDYIAGQSPGVSGDVLDFACGSGVIAAFLRARCAVSSVLATDVSAFALYAAQTTLHAQQLKTPYQVRASDGLNTVSEKFDWVITNPPFHSGQRTDYDIARAFISDVSKRLKPGGRLLIVANSFLGYNALLSERFRQVSEPVNNGRFKILQAHTPC